MIGRTRWYLRETDSTQRVAFDLARLGAPHGTVVRADYQTAGRGRQGRPWEAPSGSSLMFSMLLRPDHPIHELTPISILTADVLADVLASHANANAQIKWPNDVLLSGRKTSGILLQTRIAPEPVAVLGIGVNLNTPANLLPDGATSLAEESGRTHDAAVILEEILAGLDHLWRNYSPSIPTQKIAELDARLWMRNQTVELLDGDRVIAGVIQGVAQNGGLRLNEGGDERVIVAGEITRGPRPIAATLQD